MSFGFQILNSNGQVVLDDTLPVMVPTNQTTITPGRVLPQTRGFEFPVGRDIYYGSAIINQIGDSYRSLLTVIDSGTFITSPVSTFNLNKISSQNLPSFGMAVFDEGGEPTFHSGDNIAFVTSVINTSSFPQNITIPSNTTHIVLQCKDLGVSFPDPNVPGLVVGPSVLRTSSTNILIENKVVGSTSLIPPFYPFQQFTSSSVGIMLLQIT